MATRLSVVRIVSQIKAELDRILEHESSLSAGGISDGPEAPRVDISQTDEKLRLMFEAPGTRAEDLLVEIESNLLTVSGEKRASGPSGVSARYLRVERECGRFERSVRLPAAVNPSRGRAVLSDGVLEIEFPLVSDKRNRTYRIEVAAGEELE